MRVLKNSTKIIDQLDFKYDFNPSFGYLMHDTKYCGHGIKLRVKLKLPSHK